MSERPLDHAERAALALDALAHESGAMYLRELAQAFLTAMDDGEPDAAPLEHFTATLTRWVQVLAKDFRDSLSWRKERGLDPSGAVDGMMWAHGWLLHAIGDAGPYARQLVRDTQERAHETWLAFELGGSPDEVWQVFLGNREPCSEFLEIILRVVWNDLVRPTLARGAPVMQPSLSLAVLDRMREAHWRRGRRVDASEGVVRSEEGRVVAHLPLAAGAQVREEVARCLRATRTLAAQRLVRWLVAEGCRQRNEGGRDFRRLRVRGGFSGLARQLGLKGDKAAAELGDTLRVLQHAHLVLPHGEVGGLLTWELRAEAPGRPGELRVVLGDALLPEYTVALPKATLSQREARKLVPLPQQLPPLVGHRQTHAAQAILQLLVLRHLRQRAVELHREGGVSISPDDWAELAREAEVPLSLLPQVLEAWATGGTEGAAAFLQPLAEAPGRYTLTPAYGAESQLLRGAAQAEMHGAQRQARSRAARAKRLKRALR